nr:MAG TPA: hypothetical protein [Caudoviricetes sp.]
MKPTDIITIVVVEPSLKSIRAWMLIVQSLPLLHFGVQDSQEFPAIRPILHIYHYMFYLIPK